MHQEIETVKNLRGNEREVVAEIVKHLSVIYQDKLHLEAGYSSLFVFCKECLGYSEGAAYRRVEAAKALLVNPRIYTKLKDGSLSLCAAAELSKVIKSENSAEVVESASGKSKREVQALVAELLPPSETKRRPERVVVKKQLLPSSPVLATIIAEQECDETRTERSYTVTLELSEEEMALIHEAQKVLSTSKVKDALLGAARKLLQRKARLEKSREYRAKAKLKINGNRTSPAERRSDIEPAEKRASNCTRYISADAKHEVRKRDGERCSYVSPDGVRCCESRWLEYDHKVPFAIGGESTAENLRLLCPAHNKFEAQRVFGAEKIQRAIAKRRLELSPSI